MTEKTLAPHTDDAGVGSRRAASPSSAHVAAGAGSASAAGPAVVRPPASIPGAARLLQPWRLVSGRPLIDRSGHIAGWSLRLSDAALAQLERPDAPRVLHAAYWSALAEAAARTAAWWTARVLLVTPPPKALGDGQFVQRLPEHSVVYLDGGYERSFGSHVPDIAAQLKEREFGVAAPAYSAAAASADYCVLDAAQLGGEGALKLLGRAVAEQGRDRRGWIALNLGSLSEVRAAVRAGADFSSGALTRVVERQQNTNVVGSAVSAARVLAAIFAGRSNDDVAALLRGDQRLAARLLRLANCVLPAAGRPFESIEQVVSTTNTRELYRWLSLLLATADRSSIIAPALHEAAVARARLLELAAIARGRVDPPDGLFVTGMFSMLDVLLNVPLELALALTPLPYAATEALIAEAGPWRAYLDLALAIEAGDMPALEASCSTLGLQSDGIASLAVEAGRWAHQLLHEFAKTQEPALAPAS
jgi:hypothetical protein